MGAKSNLQAKIKFNHEHSFSFSVPRIILKTNDECSACINSSML